MRSAVLVALVTLAACGHNIGDSCKANVDCSPAGDRFCDTSAPGGYCTVDGCDLNTCPDEAVCVRFFTPVRDEPCHFNPDEPNSQSDCPRADERCLCDMTDKGVCVGGGHCAPE